LTKECPTCFPVDAPLPENWPSGYDQVPHAATDEVIARIVARSPVVVTGPDSFIIPGVAAEPDVPSMECWTVPPPPPNESEIISRRNAMSANVVQETEARFVAENLGEAVAAWFRNRGPFVAPPKRSLVAMGHWLDPANNPTSPPDFRTMSDHVVDLHNGPLTTDH
jgi:hypothetical protein